MTSRTLDGSIVTSPVSYRSLLHFPAASGEVFRNIDEQLRSWLSTKPLMWDGGLVGASRSDKARLDGTERRERDGSRTNHLRYVEQTPTGEWTVRLTAHSRPSDDPWLLIEVASPQVDEQSRSVAAAPPRLVRQLLEVLPARDGVSPMTSEPTIVRADGVPEVLAAVKDPARRGLVFVAGTPEDFPIDRWRDHLAALVRDTVGLASTFVLDAEATQLARSALGAHGPDVGALRTYLCGMCSRAASVTRPATASSPLARWSAGPLATCGASCRVLLAARSSIDRCRSTWPACFAWLRAGMGPNSPRSRPERVGHRLRHPSASTEQEMASPPSTPPSGPGSTSPFRMGCAPSSAPTPPSTSGP
jgi:hypothetical protein